MNIEKALIGIILSEGVKLSPFRLAQVKRQIKEAILGNRFSFVERNRKAIGFFTWQEKDKGIFINNMCILSNFRNKDNFLYIRKMLRNKYPKAKCFYWKNRRHNKEVVIY